MNAIPPTDFLDATTVVADAFAAVFAPPEPLVPST